MSIHICIHINIHITKTLLIYSLNLSSGIRITGVEEVLVNEGDELEDQVEEDREEGIVEEGIVEGTEIGRLSTLIIFLYCPCCLLECAIIYAVLLYSSSVF